MEEYVIKHFEERKQKVLNLIRNADIKYKEIGIFGSYARNEYKATSDIDFCIITDEKPNHYVKGELRCDAEDLGADIIFVSPEYFSNNESAFARALRRDYRRIEEYGK